ncbi:protein RALF-like 24 [Prosopis cineraria]|uniref:protein RALF-like 24 n=1 Tax=Prosopis cineraria TaxID=364024 RepID=UPI00240FCFED|nr:protein RALF-like 24 [Prosopis cineraria]
MCQPSVNFWTYLCLSLVVLHTHLPICEGLSVVDLNLLEHGQFHAMTKRVCRKSIGECLTDPQMGSDSNRRLLAMQKRYISYETLRRDMVPCDRAGASYYSCHATQANPHNRGCEVITGCARGIKGINS